MAASQSDHIVNSTNSFVNDKCITPPTPKQRVQPERQKLTGYHQHEVIINKRKRHSGVKLAIQIESGWVSTFYLYNANFILRIRISF